MKNQILILLGAALTGLSTSCTTLDVLDGTQSTDYRKVRVEAHLIDNDADTILYGLGLTYQLSSFGDSSLLDGWAGDLDINFADDEDGFVDDYILFSAGLRRVFDTGTRFSPYVGAGIAGASFETPILMESESDVGVYGRLGLDFAWSEKLSTALEYRVFDEASDDGVFGLSMGFGF